MTTPHQHNHDTAFMVASKGVKHFTRRTWAGGKKHAVSITAATLLASAIGEVKDLLVQHWEAQAEQKQFDELKAQMQTSNQAMWQAIERKRDK